MESLYDKYNGMLKTFPENAEKYALASYKSRGIMPEPRKYTKEIFDAFINRAAHYVFFEIKYVDGSRKDGGYGGSQRLTPENMIIYRNELYAVQYYQLCAVGSVKYIIPLEDMVNEPCLVDSHVDRFDDYGDHESWTVDTYIKMDIKMEYTVHKMKLSREPFKMISSGFKTIELRLLDEKRRNIRIDDEIVFTCVENGEKIRARVVDLHYFDSFEDLYKSLPLLKCGYTEQNVKSAKASDMEEFYSAQEQKEYGVVGIELCICQ